MVLSFGDSGISWDQDSGSGSSGSARIWTAQARIHNYKESGVATAFVFASSACTRFVLRPLAVLSAKQPWIPLRCRLLLLHRPNHLRQCPLACRPTLSRASLARTSSCGSPAASTTMVRPLVFTRCANSNVLFLSRCALVS